MTSPTQELVNFVAETDFKDIPSPVVQKTKQVLLDSIGCALGSYAVDRARIALEFVKELGGKEQATVIGDSKTSLALAAFANGELINALDYDALGPGLGGHIVPYIIPPSLAIGERVKASGKDLIAALALALEIGSRVRSSMPQLRILTEEPPYFGHVPRSSHATPAVFGAVAGGCKLLGLDAKKIANAFGIVGASAPVPAGMKWEQTGGPSIMTKYNAWSGWVALLAAAGALLAEKGFTGDTTILDGEWGFWKIVGAPSFELDKLLQGLGREWHAANVWFKVYPCCGGNHTAIDAINKIMEENEIQPEDVEAIVVETDPFQLTPNRMGTEICSFEDTQFSNAYLYALAVYHGRKPSPAWQLPSTFRDPGITKLMKNVQVRPHPKAEELIINRLKSGEHPIFRQVTVEVIAKRRKYKMEMTLPKGSPAKPLTEDELKEKFRNNASYSALRTEKAEKAIEVLCALEELEDITRLTNLLTTG